MIYRYLLILFFFIVNERSFSQEVFSTPELRGEVSPEDIKTHPRLRGDARYQKSRLTSDQSEMLADHRDLKLAKGVDKIVDLNFDAFSGARGIEIGNTKLVTVTAVKVGENRQLLFKPIEAGDTTVTVRDSSGAVKIIFRASIVPSDLYALMTEVSELLREIEGIEVKILGKKVVIDGEILVPTDWGRIANVLSERGYAESILNLATFSPLALENLSQRIGGDISSFAQNVKTRVVNQQIWLEGSVENEDLKRRSFNVALLYLPAALPPDPIDKDQNIRKGAVRGLIQNFIVVNPPPPKRNQKMVRVTVHFVELAKDYNKLFGMKWQPGFTADPQISFGTNAEGAAAASGGTFSATLSALFPKLQSAQTAGFARVIRVTDILVKDKQKGNFSDSTKIPILVSGPNGSAQSSTANVELSVEVTPEVLGNSDDIALDIAVAQSSLVGKSGNNPIVSSRNAKSRIYVKANESAAVAAMEAQDVTTSFNKDEPDGGKQFDAKSQTSPLFSLLRSKNFAKKKSQFVVFVTPVIIENASDGTEDLRKNFRVNQR